MKTFLRYSLHVYTEVYPYKAPYEVQLASQKILERCSRYIVSDQIMLLLVPIDTEEYQLIMNFREQYKPYTSDLLIYEHKFTKKELREADYYLLSSTSLIIDFDVDRNYDKCCEDGDINDMEQVGFYTVKPSIMKNKIISFTADYHFFISCEAKEKMEEKGITNIRFIPVYSKRNLTIVAYQIESAILLDPLSKINGWSISRECLKCHKKYWEPIHKVVHPFYIPLSWKDTLNDFNSTDEIFTEVGSRYYVISKKFYNILVESGAKKLKCQPISFIDV